MGAGAPGPHTFIIMRPTLASLEMAVLLTLSLCAAPACRRLDGPEEAGNGRTLSLVLSLKNVQPGQEVTTKMPGDVTQADGDFRGIDHLYVVPFNTESLQVEPQDHRLGARNVGLSSSGIAKTGLVDNNNSHLFGSAIVPNGMNTVLVYGKAPDRGEASSRSDKHTYGVLNPVGLDNPSSSDDILFSLEPILSSGEASESTEVTSVADELLEKLNGIMSLMGNSGFDAIKGIHDSVNHSNQILSCSYSTFDQLRIEIQSALIRIPYESQALLDEIRLVIQALGVFSDALSAAGTSFPMSYGIPEGTLGFWWNGKAFVRLINGVNIRLVDPETYCYPPSLWYYANSPVQTSNNEKVSLQYNASNEQWDDILVHYTDGGTVNSFTQGVAVSQQLQYGVGLLELSLAEPGEEAANLISGCPLTGIIIGDQRDVDFRFMPSTGAARYIYDNVAGNLKIGTTGNSVQTLVLQTVDNAPVHFALEFRNNTGYTRHCQQGDILPWTRFYLAGVLDPASADVTQPAGENIKSIFSRDRKTRVSVKVDGLRNAYTTVPDLHSPQLEIGLVTEMKWMQLTPQSLILDF